MTGEGAGNAGLLPEISTDLLHLCEALGRQLIENRARLVTVESCTGGGMAYALTEVAGSSCWFEQGLVTYSNQAKHSLADVPLSLIEQYGAVSEEVARAMAAGGLARCNAATLSVAVTGIAGPGGGNAAKPVGLVCFAWAKKSGETIDVLAVDCCRFTGDRHQIRSSSVGHGLSRLLTLLD